jgi:hypothetical protein
MAKNKVNEHVITEEMLNSFEIGKPIARFGFFVNLIFIWVEEGRVVFADQVGNVKTEPVWLFLKHARVAK